MVVSASPALNELEAAKVALAETWAQLAVYVDQATQFEAEGANGNGHDYGADAWPTALTRWLNVFETELGAVQTVADAVRSGVNVPAHDVRVARNAAEKLLQIIESARERVTASAA